MHTFWPGPLLGRCRPSGLTQHVGEPLTAQGAGAWDRFHPNRGELSCSITTVPVWGLRAMRVRFRSGGGRALVGSPRDSLSGYQDIEQCLPSLPGYQISLNKPSSLTNRGMTKGLVWCWFSHLRFPRFGQVCQAGSVASVQGL